MVFTTTKRYHEYPCFSLFIHLISIAFCVSSVLGPTYVVFLQKAFCIKWKKWNSSVGRFGSLDEYFSSP